MSRPQTVVKPYSDPQTSPLGTQKDKNDPEIKSNSKFRIERNIEYESSSTTLLDPKTVVKPYSDPQTSPFGPIENWRLIFSLLVR